MKPRIRPVRVANDLVVWMCVAEGDSKECGGMGSTMEDAYRRCQEALRKDADYQLFVRGTKLLEAMLILSLVTGLAVWWFA